MDGKVERELQSIELAISSLAYHTKRLSLWVDYDADLIESMRQYVVALHYMMETLKTKVALETFVDKT
ncbi:hypothetical protein ACFLYG_01560 [Chloroflexota bacterium]